MRGSSVDESGAALGGRGWPLGSSRCGGFGGAGDRAVGLFDVSFESLRTTVAARCQCRKTNQPDWRVRINRKLIEASERSKIIFGLSFNKVVRAPDHSGPRNQCLDGRFGSG